MIVISDMMGTLTTGSPVLGLVDWVRQAEPNTPPVHGAMLPSTFLPSGAGSTGKSGGRT
jgi:hypothetical protein